MRARLSDTLNSWYMRLVRRAAKWVLLALLAALITIGTSVQFAVPKAKKALSDGKGVVVTRDLDGQPVTIYENDKIPKGYDEELSVGAPQLIYNNQARSLEHADHAGHDEDHPLDETSVPPQDRKKLQSTVGEFLTAWETFDVGETDDSYRQRLIDLVDPGREEEIVTRDDNNQNPAISRDGITGSQLEEYSDPGGSMRVLRYDGSTAYVSAQAEILYTGPALNWAGRRVIRSYGIVLTRFRDGWRVSRSAAQTQGSIIE